uniref:hypothetical protein n=1 Tax=Enterocloster clostridioformis TaxID=1531 RepID=UPI0025A5F6B4
APFFVSVCLQNYIITKGCFLFIPFYGLHKFPLPEIYFTLLSNNHARRFQITTTAATIRHSP